MSLELLRDVIRINKVIGEDSTQTVVENDIIVPDIKPDVARILLLDGDIYSYDADGSQDRVAVSGSVQYKILYVSDDEERSIKSITTSANFSLNLDIPGTRSGMVCRVKCEIEHIDFEVLNGRKINVRAIIKASGKVSEDVEQGVISGLSDASDVQVLKSNVKISGALGESTEEFSVKEALGVPGGKPAIRELLRNDVKVTGKDFSISDDKIIAKGEINVSTLYIGDDESRSIQFMEHEIPFTQVISLDGVNEDCTCDVDFRISDVEFELEEDSDGELRVINADVSLKTTATGFNKRSIDVLEDAYGRQVKLNIEKEPLKVEEIVAENKSQIILKDTLQIQEDSPKILEIFNVLCKPTVSDVSISDDKVIIEGVVANSVLYLANNEEQPVFSSNQEVPFKHSVDIKGINRDMACETALDIEHCNYSLVSVNEVEIRLVLNLSIKVTNQAVVPLAVKVVEAPADDRSIESQPSITIYFTKPEDTLWNIAKKYLTTVDEIRIINNIKDRDILYSGQQIVIPKKIV